MSKAVTPRDGRKTNKAKLRFWARRGLVLHRGVVVPSNVVRFKCRVQAGLIFIPTLVIPVWFEQELEGAGWGLGMVLFGAVPTPSQQG